MPKSKPIILSAVTPAEINKMKKGLAKYQFIQSNIGNTPAFRQEFGSFYFVPRQSITDADIDIFFREMFASTPTDALAFADLLNKNGTSKFFFSYATKAVHTFNTGEPIYDSHICEYLREQRKVPLKRYYQQGKQKAFYKYNWVLIKAWYNSFLLTPECDEWVEWFDKEFPAYCGITRIKKVDTMIYALGVE